MTLKISQNTASARVKRQSDGRKASLVRWGYRPSMAWDWKTEIKRLRNNVRAAAQAEVDAMKAGAAR